MPTLRHLAHCWSRYLPSPGEACAATPRAQIGYSKDRAEEGVHCFVTIDGLKSAGAQRKGE